MFLFQVVKQAGPESKSQITRAAMFKAYNEISDKIGAMMNAIASSNSSAILPYSGSPLDIGFEILNSKAYKEVLSKCPEFEAIFQSAMYGLRLCQIGDTPEKTALMKAVSDELWLHHEEQMGAKLAHPPQTSEDLRPLNDIFRANAFYSLSDLHNNMLDGFLSIQLSDALKTNNMSAINNVLDLMALFQDMRYGVVRTEPVPKSPFPLVAGDGVKNQTAGLNNLPPEILAERGKLHLEKTPEDRFLETSKVYAVNKAIVNGNTAYASQLLAANLGKTASGKSKNLEIDYGTSTNTYANKADFGLEVAYSTSPVVYANRCGLADMYILQPKSFLPLVPFYLGIKDLATAFYRWGTTGKFDKELAAIGAAYLTLDVFAIMTGGFSKGATLLLKSERTVAKFAELSAEAIKIENRLKKIETLIITAKSTTVLTKELNLLKTDLEILANLNKDILGVVKPLRFQGGVREVFTAKNITTKVKRTENIIKETQNLTAAPAPGTAPLTPAEMALQVNKLSLKYAKFGSSSAQYAEKLTAIMGLKSTLNYGIGRFTSENAGKVENALKPLLHSSQKSYAKYLDELGNAAKTEINALKDGEHLTISFKQTGDGFTFVKEGDKTLVYRTSEFAPTTTLVKDIAVGDAKTLWGKLLPPVPLNKEVADRLIAGLEVNDFAKLDELSEGEQLTVTVKKMKYTIIKGPEVGGVATFSVFKESVLASYWNTIKSTYETASKSLGTASNRAPGVVSNFAGKADNVISSIPTATANGLMYKTKTPATGGFFSKLKPETGVKEMFKDGTGLGYVPRKLNQAAQWTRGTKLFSKESALGNLGFRYTKDDVFRATELGNIGYGAYGMWGLRFPIGLVSGTGHLVTYPLKYGLTGASEVIGGTLIGVEGAVGVGLKLGKMSVLTLGGQHVIPLFAKFAVQPLDDAIKEKIVPYVEDQIEKYQHGTGANKKRTTLKKEKPAPSGTTSGSKGAVYHKKPPAQKPAPKQDDANTTNTSDGM